MKKVLIINDTSSECHHGCDLVMKNINKILFKFNFDKIFRIFSGKTLIGNKNIIKKLKYINLVLFNGEGTLNNSQERAKNIIKDLIYLKKYHQLPLVLINSTIYKNNHFIMKNLKLFDLIYVRSNLDKKYLLKYKIKSKVVPDLTFYKFSKSKIKKKNIEKNSITDCYNDSISEKFYEFSKKNNFKFLTIRRDLKLNSLNFLKIISFVKYNIIKIFVLILFKFKIKIKYNYYVKLYFTHKLNDYLKHIEKSKLLICGRFHSMCFALQTLTPFYFIKLAVNSHKSEGLLNDIGLKNRIIHFKELNGKSFKDFKKNEIKLIKKYIYNSNFKINKMFKEISKLVETKF